MNRRIALSAASVALLMLLNGCSSDSSSEDEWQVTANGVGSINAMTPFAYSVLEELLPDYRINQGLGTSEGERFEVLYIYNQDAEKQFTLSPLPGGNVVHSVEVHSSDYKTANGHGLNTTFQQVYPDALVAKCFPGVEEMSGSVICAAPSADNIRFVFSGVWDGVDGELPPQDVLNTWPLDRFFWVAKAAEPVVDADVATTDEDKTVTDK